MEFVSLLMLVDDDDNTDDLLMVVVNWLIGFIGVDPWDLQLRLLLT